MLRCAILLVGCAVLTGAGTNRTRAGADPDPVKEKLFAAKVAYDAEMDRYRKAAEQWFDAREQAARKDGNKKLVEQINAERISFDEGGELPNGAADSLRLRPALAQRKLESAFAQAVKDYTKARMDEEAAEVEASWKRLAAEFPTDLVALINTKQHTVSGNWKRDGTKLIGTSSDKSALLQLPYEPATEYDISLQCTRVAGDDCIGIGIVAGGRQVMAVIDSAPAAGYFSGLHLINKKPVGENATTVKGRLMKSNQSYVLLVRVRKEKVDVCIDGKVIVSYKGDSTNFSLYEWDRVPNQKALFLFVNKQKTTYQIDRVVHRPVSGHGVTLK